MHLLCYLFISGCIYFRIYGRLKLKRTCLLFMLDLTFQPNNWCLMRLCLNLSFYVGLVFCSSSDAITMVVATAAATITIFPFLAVDATTNALTTLHHHC
ncbi:hypothetical protein QVD17_33033 [Tagetes erecta]|uniref:Uncharacterized protein n=1 Tax=Tagetes erecta TaxID=13708 RepID=A0AAD8JWZ6_TARER|nr:hypothetical protein QVD17_33033 [Tagetes erecta]